MQGLMIHVHFDPKMVTPIKQDWTDLMTQIKKAATVHTENNEKDTKESGGR